MSYANAIQVAGPTYALSVANTQHAAVAILPSDPQSNFAMVLNSGAVDLCVTIAPLTSAGAAATPALVFPVEGTPTVPNAFILHANAVNQPLYIKVPSGGFSISAIGASAGPSIMYVTPINLYS